jgi:DNA-repair protein complementing XP-A cells
MREQVETFAIRKWGSLEALDIEFERREIEKKEKKEKKYLEKVSRLRAATRTSTWNDQLQADGGGVHSHEWVDTIELSDDGSKQQECSICHMKIQVEEF